jgi:ATP diphosphatase
MTQSERLIDELLDIMRKLRSPETGCPWDIEQDFDSIAPYTLEEAYEVVDAIARRDWDDLREELGDLLFQVVYHAQMAEEDGRFAFGDVVRLINEKLIRRHPHVFGDAVVADAAQQSVAWERHKAQERSVKRRPGLLDDIPTALPALVRAQKLQGRAARVGFDWPDASGVLEKLHEEISELEQARLQADSRQRAGEELGDLLFTCVNLARHLGVDAEQVLSAASARFETRFRAMEAMAGGGRALDDLSPAQWDSLWRRAKAGQRDG